MQKQKQFQKLEEKKNDREVEVIRAGSHERISVFDVCVGDIVVLTSGDILSVDGVYTRGHGILFCSLFSSLVSSFSPPSPSLLLSHVMSIKFDDC